MLQLNKIIFAVFRCPLAYLTFSMQPSTTKCLQKVKTKFSRKKPRKINLRISHLPELQTNYLKKQSFADVLQNTCSQKFGKFHKKTPALKSLFIKKRLQHRCFPGNPFFCRTSLVAASLSLIYRKILHVAGICYKYLKRKYKPDRVIQVYCQTA